ncbi:MAG: hypothetical protein KFF50_13950 [Desulfatitalea sp.]|nr:hypothetical protein [Desulfatitalea sp.]
MPNGYRFHRLFSTGEALTGAGDADFLPPSVKIHDNNQIIFHAGDRLGRSGSGLSMGLYELDMDYGSQEPRIEGFHKIVRVGDRTADGRNVVQVQLADLNAQGSVAIRLLTEGEQATSLYLERHRGHGASADGLQRVLGFRTPTPDTNFIFGAALGNFDLYDNDDLLVASFWAEVNGRSTGESLFHLPNGEVSADGSNLLTSGAVIPGTDRQISKFGLMHANDYGAYAAQVHTEVIDRNVDPSPDPGSAILKGTVMDAGVTGASLLAVSAGTRMSTALRSSQVDSAESLNYGPRIGANGDVALVTMISDDSVRLTLGPDTISGTGYSTPTGMTIEGIGGPVVSADGLVYFVARSGDTEELLVSNGGGTTSLLKTGDKLFGARGPALTTIAFGYAREQVDSYGRLVFIGEFDDGTLSIMLGVPL